MEKKYITRKNLPVLIILAILGILSYRYFSPFGKIVHYRFGSKLPGVEETTTFSSNEGNILKIPSQIIKTNQSRLSLKILSKDIKSAKAVLKFKKGPKEIKLGVRASEKDKFLYQPLYHSLLQDLNWEKIEENDFSLWQKEKEYQTLYDFINNPDQNKKTASYFVDKNKLLNFKLIEAKKEDKVVVNIPLRGSHSFLVRVDKKPLILKITKQDTNWYKGEDRFKISVLNGQNTLIEKTINDDGITDTSMLKADPQEKTITLENIEPGTYQVNMAYEGKTISDSIITKIEINQEKIIFKDGVFIEGNKPVILWTNSSKLDVLTSHTRSLQTLKIDNQYDIKIEKVKETYSLDLKSLTGEKEEGHLCQLNSPKSDLRISGNGYFAFSQDSFFDPEIIKTIDLAELDDLENIDYVLAAYSKPKEDNNWLTAEVFFDLENIKTDDDKLYFSLEVPDLNNYGGELEIDYLEIEINSGGFLAKKGAEEVKGIAVKDNIFSRISRAPSCPCSEAFINHCIDCSRFFSTPSPLPYINPRLYCASGSFCCAAL